MVLYGKDGQYYGIAAQQRKHHESQEENCWRNLCPDVMHDFTAFITEPVKEI